MAWWGKLIGGALGFMAGGGPLGALLGVALGHQFDKGMAGGKDAPLGGQAGTEEVQAAFFTAAFSVMGHIAKADGQVSKNEIRAAEAVMEHMRLDAQQRKLAVNLFQEGKQTGFDLDGVLGQFRRVCGRRLDLMRMFLEIQFHAAYADGQVHTAERELLMYITRQLGISSADAQRIEALIQAHYGADGTRRESSCVDALHTAYAILGIRPEANDAELKRAYRRLMNQHHPDKLVARGMPEEMVRMATEKSQKIREAYERIKKSRGLK